MKSPSEYLDALRTCDNHSIYKNGAKEIAAQEGMALPFMAKFNEREGNSCHIHWSFRVNLTDPWSWAESADGHVRISKQVICCRGQLAHARELTLTCAPQIQFVC